MQPVSFCATLCVFPLTQSCKKNMNAQFFFALPFLWQLLRMRLYFCIIFVFEPWGKFYSRIFSYYSSVFYLILATVSYFLAAVVDFICFSCFLYWFVKEVCLCSLILFCRTTYLFKAICFDRFVFYFVISFINVAFVDLSTFHLFFRVLPLLMGVGSVSM